LGGALEVVVPAERYRDEQAAGHRTAFDVLVARASAVETLAYRASSDEAYAAAGRRLVDHSDVLMAVWDGCPARGPGGTGDVVAYARACGTPVEVLWPHGSQR